MGLHKSVFVSVYKYAYTSIYITEENNSNKCLNAIQIRLLSDFRDLCKFGVFCSLLFIYLGGWGTFAAQFSSPHPKPIQIVRVMPFC